MAGFEQLDARNLRYRFDLEKDIPWEKAREPGPFFPVEYFDTLGFDTEALGQNPEAYGFLQKLLALCTCQAFAHLEDDVILFLREEHDAVPITRSSLLLVEEEVKHTVLFRRFSSILCEQTPGLEEAFVRHYSRPPGFDLLKREREKLGKPEVLHYLFWLNTIFFEEFTIHLHELLKGSSQPIQEAWKAVHKCHRQEEIQHVITDRAYIDSSPLTGEERDQCSILFFLALERDLLKFFSLDCVEKVMKERYPDISLFARPPRLRDLPLFDGLLNSPSFRQTRHAAPGLDRFRVNSGDAPLHE